ncbi:hypothetical protein APUTEX25_002066, partial [Auxenochlorella protothecoides]
AWERTTASGMPTSGPELTKFLETLYGKESGSYPPGTRLWVSGKWPGVAWSLSLCNKGVAAALVLSRPAATTTVLVRYYGEHTTAWVTAGRCQPFASCEDEERAQHAALAAWCQKTGRRVSSWTWLGAMHLSQQVQQLHATEEELESSSTDPAQEAARMASLYERHTRASQSFARCYACQGAEAQLACSTCRRWFHTLCLECPSLGPQFVPAQRWVCPGCKTEQQVQAATSKRQSEDADEDESERMGLTPDWIIETVCFGVFGLQRPTAEVPFIKGLLDPCSNSRVAPNIPAEVLYDKHVGAGVEDNGLALKNEWKGFYILLNPPFHSQMQWRFVNRAIDAVERGEVPGVLLVCRNSTDANYFQRLRPYPRVLLGRKCALFKDYDKSPNGFGIAAVMLAKRERTDLYLRFYDAFERFGEPSIPIDRTFLLSGEFSELLGRLREYADEHHRDHWAMCSACGRWRIVDYEQLQGIKDATAWKCTMLRSGGSCNDPLTRREAQGDKYAPGEPEPVVVVSKPLPLTERWQCIMHEQFPVPMYS